VCFRNGTQTGDPLSSPDCGTNYSTIYTMSSGDCPVWQVHRRDQQSGNSYYSRNLTRLINRSQRFPKARLLSLNQIGGVVSLLAALSRSCVHANPALCQATSIVTSDLPCRKLALPDLTNRVLLAEILPDSQPLCFIPQLPAYARPP
jgi:hypothetical protein